MARLPQPGGDDNQWGDILNEYLRQSHTAAGTLGSGTVGTGQLQDDAVTEDKLSSDVRVKLNAPGPQGPQGEQGPPGPTGSAGNGNVRFYDGGAWQSRGSSPFPVTFDAGLHDPVPPPTDWLPGDHIISLNPPVVP